MPVTENEGIRIMKIHSDTITHWDISRATRAAGMTGVYTEREDRRGSRKRDHAFDVSLRGTSNRRPNPGTGGRSADDETERAATWDEWGMFINALFLVDPNAIIGVYDGQNRFDDATGCRFADLIADEQHRNHKWTYDPSMGFLTCSCGAVNDRLALV